MPSKKPTILVVDDNVDIRGFIALALEKKAEVLQASTVPEAEAILDTRSDIVLLLTDWEIPNRHTTGASIICKAREKGVKKVIVLTASDDQGQLQEIAALKPDQLLAKPVNLVNLEAAVDQLLAQKD